MTDDSLLWTHKPAPRCRPRAAEPLWSVQGRVAWSAELRFHGEYGVEAEILAGWRLSIGGSFRVGPHRVVPGPKNETAIG